MSKKKKKGWKMVAKEKGAYKKKKEARKKERVWMWERKEKGEKRQNKKDRCSNMKERKGRNSEDANRKKERH